MNRKRKNEIKYFYQILSDIKNNIDTLIKELYENQNNLEFYAKSKPVILKSKYPDLKKLNIHSIVVSFLLEHLTIFLIQRFREEVNVLTLFLTRYRKDLHQNLLYLVQIWCNHTLLLPFLEYWIKYFSIIGLLFKFF